MEGTNCIYMYINKINNKKYIGQCQVLERRIREHLNAATNKNNSSYNSPFHKALRKYGQDSFDIIILKKDIKTQCLKDLWEYYYIEKYNTFVNTENGYNVAEGGFGGNKFKGKTKDEMDAIKEKMRSSSTGKLHKEETKRKISKANKGRKFTEEHKNKLRTPKSEETKRKLSEAKKGKNNPMYGRQRPELSETMKGENNWMYGKHHTEESKKKMSDKLRGEKSFKRIKQYDLDGNLIKIWDNVVEIEKELGIKRSNIYSCCKKVYKTCRGYIWEFEE